MTGVRLPPEWEPDSGYSLRILSLDVVGFLPKGGCGTMGEDGVVRTVKIVESAGTKCAESSAPNCYAVITSHRVMTASKLAKRFDKIRERNPQRKLGTHLKRTTQRKIITQQHE